MKRSLLYFLILILVIGLYPINIGYVEASSTSLLYQINAYSDDAYYNELGLFLNDMPFLYLANPSIGYASGLRFNNTQVPKGSYINESKISVYVNTAYASGIHQVTIYGIDEYNLTTFLTIESLRDKLLTNNYVNWNVSNVNTPGQWYNITVTDIVQEIVNKNNWTLGMSIGFKIISSKSDNITRAICTWETHTSRTQGAKLYIIYSLLAPEGINEGWTFLTQVDNNYAMNSFSDSKIIYNPTNEHYYIFYFTSTTWKYRFADKDDLNIWSIEYNTGITRNQDVVGTRCLDILFDNNIFKMVTLDWCSVYYYNATFNIDFTLNIGGNVRAIYNWPQHFYVASITVQLDGVLHIYYLADDAFGFHITGWYESIDNGNTWTHIKWYSEGTSGAYGVWAESIELDFNNRFGVLHDDSFGRLVGCLNSGNYFYLENDMATIIYFDLSNKGEYLKMFYQNWTTLGLSYRHYNRITSSLSNRQAIYIGYVPGAVRLYICSDYDTLNDYMYWVDSVNDTLCEVWRNHTTTYISSMREVLSYPDMFNFVSGIRRADLNKKIVLAFITGTSAPYNIYIYWRDILVEIEEEETPPPEDPTPPGWIDYPISRFNFKAFMLILGLIMMFGTLGYLIYDRPDLHVWILGFLMMLIGLGFVIGIQYF